MSISIDDNITILNSTSNSLIVKSTANAANMEFMLGSNDENTNIVVKDNQVVPGTLHCIPASGQYLTKNSLHTKEKRNKYPYNKEKKDYMDDEFANFIENNENR